MGQLAEEFSTLLLSRSQAEERKEKGNNLSPAKAVIFLSRKSGAGFLCFVAVCQVYFIYRGIFMLCVREAVDTKHNRLKSAQCLFKAIYHRSTLGYSTDDLNCFTH